MQQEQHFLQIWSWLYEFFPSSQLYFYFISKLNSFLIFLTSIQVRLWFKHLVLIASSYGPFAS